MFRRLRRGSSLLLVVLLLGCTLGDAAQPTPSPPQSNQPLPVVAQRPAFAPFQPVAVSGPAAVPAYDLDPNKAATQEVLQRFPPNEAQLELLRANGFVALQGRGVRNGYDLYIEAEQRGLPILVTVDPLLHSYHLLFDYTLRKLETDYFYSDLKAMTGVLISDTLALYRSSEGQRNLHEAARRNLAYLQVAERLLDPTASFAASPVDDLVTSELALIEQHAGFTDSPIFGGQLDYSQFVPRGHYTRSDLLKNYFKAMMWYGLTNFRLTDQEDPARAVRQTRQAILLSAALANPQLRVGDRPLRVVWQRIYDVTSFFVGQSDDLGFLTYDELARQTFGQSFSPRDLEADDKIAAFIAVTDRLPAPQINSGWRTDEEPEDAIKGWRLMGQRFIVDSYFFQQLVYDKVGTRDDPRTMPQALDIAAAFGSDRAYDLLKPTEAKFQNYEQQLDKLQAETAKFDPATWTQNLYWAWLYSLEPLLAPKGSGYPAFMQNPAWTDRQLATYLGSWTELRHDTILYAKQSNTVVRRGMMSPPQPDEAATTRGYVEPQPEVYARLEASARQIKAGLAERDLLPDDYAAQYERIAALLGNLRRISETELAYQPLLEADYTVIRRVGYDLRDVNGFFKRQDGISSEADEQEALVSDVHTDPNTEQVLQEATGNPVPLLVVAPVDGKPTLTVGVQFVHYEFAGPIGKRLTDEQWQERLASGDLPPLAAWVASFLKIAKW